MTTKHRAYALTEMLIIIAALVLLMALSVKPFRLMITEIPRSSKIYQTQNTKLFAEIAMNFLRLIPLPLKTLSLSFMDLSPVDS